MLIAEVVHMRFSCEGCFLAQIGSYFDSASGRHDRHDFWTHVEGLPSSKFEPSLYIGIN